MAVDVTDLTDVIGMYFRARHSSARYGMSCEEEETVTEPDEDKAAPQNLGPDEEHEEPLPIDGDEITRGVEHDRALAEDPFGGEG